MGLASTEWAPLAYGWACLKMSPESLSSSGWIGSCSVRRRLPNNLHMHSGGRGFLGCISVARRETLLVPRKGRESAAGSP